jgi:hypothetical protein
MATGSAWILHPAEHLRDDAAHPSFVQAQPVADAAACATLCLESGAPSATAPEQCRSFSVKPATTGDGMTCSLSPVALDSTPGNGLADGYSTAAFDPIEGAAYYEWVSKSQPPQPWPLHCTHKAEHVASPWIVARCKAHAEKAACLAEGFVTGQESSGECAFDDVHTFTTSWYTRLPRLYPDYAPAADTFTSTWKVWPGQVAVTAVEDAEAVTADGVQDIDTCVSSCLERADKACLSIEWTATEASPSLGSCSMYTVRADMGSKASPKVKPASASFFYYERHSFESPPSTVPQRCTHTAEGTTDPQHVVKCRAIIGEAACKAEQVCVHVPWVSAPVEVSEVAWWSCECDSTHRDSVLSTQTLEADAALAADPAGQASAWRADCEQLCIKDPDCYHFHVGAAGSCRLADRSCAMTQLTAPTLAEGESAPEDFKCYTPTARSNTKPKLTSYQCTRPVQPAGASTAHNPFEAESCASASGSRTTATVETECTAKGYCHHNAPYGGTVNAPADQTPTRLHAGCECQNGDDPTHVKHTDKELWLRDI